MIGFLHLHTVFMVHWSMHLGFTSLCCWGILQRAATPHFINSFIKRWTFGWLSSQGYFGQCCYEHSCASSRVDMHTHSSWVYIFWGDGAMLGLGCGMWEVVAQPILCVWGGSSFLNRGQTQAPALGAWVLATGSLGKSHPGCYSWPSLSPTFFTQMPKQS